MRATLILLLAAGLALADPKPGEEGTPEHQQAANLVKQLGDKRYATREAAAKKLIEMGPAAVPALTAGTKSEDEEVRNRSIALLPQARAAEWKRRAAAYLADAEGKQKHDLPLLDQWDKLVGKPDTGSRKLFAEMVKTNGELLQKATDRKVAAAAVTERCKIIVAQTRGPKGQVKAEIGDLATILFVDGLVPPKNANWSQDAPAKLLANPTLSENIGETDMGPALRKVLAKWFGARPAHDNMAQQQFSLLAQKKPFPEAGPVLAKLAKDKNADIFSVRMLAVQALGKVGGKDAESVLNELVSDKTPLFGGGGPNEHFLGDTALAASLTLHGKKLTDFGLRSNGSVGFSTGDDSDIISINLYGFNSVDGREKAIKKWKEEVIDKKDSKKDEKKEEKK
jgi:hypothetical protein